MANAKEVAVLKEKTITVGGETTGRLVLKHETCVAWKAVSSAGEVISEGVIGGYSALDDPELIEAVETKILLARLCERVAQFRLRQEGVPWTETPVLEERAFCPQDGPDERAIELVRQHGREVRWNWKGSARGHYVFELEGDEAVTGLKPQGLHPTCPKCGENLLGDALVRLEGVKLAEDGFTCETYEGTFDEVVLTYCPACGWKEGGARYYLTGKTAQL